METNLVKLLQTNFSWSYCKYVFGISLIIRIIMSFFKAFGICQGEADRKDDVTGKVVIFSKDAPHINGEVVNYAWSRWRAFFNTLIGFSFDANRRSIDDYWLSTLMGIVELYVYPCLMIVDKWSVIGAWIGIKTASAWGMWQKTRTVYSRFLFGNLLALAVSFWLIQFVKK